MVIIWDPSYLAKWEEHWTRHPPTYHFLPSGYGVLVGFLSLVRSTPKAAGCVRPRLVFGRGMCYCFLPVIFSSSPAYARHSWCTVVLLCFLRSQPITPIANQQCVQGKKPAHRRTVNGETG